MTRLHSKAGYGHIVLKKDLMKKLDKLKVSTPYKKESYSDVIKRLLEQNKKPKPKPKPKVSTPQSSVNLIGSSIR